MDWNEWHIWKDLDGRSKAWLEKSDISFHLEFAQLNANNYITHYVYQFYWSIYVNLNLNQNITDQNIDPN